MERSSGGRGNDKVERPREKGKGEDLIEVEVSGAACQLGAERKQVTAYERMRDMSSYGRSSSCVVSSILGSAARTDGNGGEQSCTRHPALRKTLPPARDPLQC